MACLLPHWLKTLARNGWAVSTKPKPVWDPRTRAPCCLDLVIHLLVEEAVPCQRVVLNPKPPAYLRDFPRRS